MRVHLWPCGCRSKNDPADGKRWVVWTKTCAAHTHGLGKAVLLSAVPEELGASRVDLSEKEKAKRAKALDREKGKRERASSAGSALNADPRLQEQEGDKFLDAGCGRCGDKNCFGGCEV